MFEQAVLSTGSSGRRMWMTSAGMAGQAIVLTLAIAGALLWPETLPKVQLALLMPPMPVSAPPVRVIARPRDAVPTPRPFELAAITQPTLVPQHAAQVIEAPPVAGSIVIGGGGVPGDTNAGDIPGLSIGVAAPPPRPAENAKVTAKPSDPAPVQRVRVSSGVNPPQLLHMVQPVYPGLARTAHIGGSVELTGVIGIDGRVRELRVLRGHPLLTKAALDAVAQWVYAPTRLNNEVVEVITNITVTFKLD